MSSASLTHKKPDKRSSHRQKRHNTCDLRLLLLRQPGRYREPTQENADVVSAVALPRRPMPVVASTRTLLPLAQGPVLSMCPVALLLMMPPRRHGRRTRLAALPSGEAHVLYVVRDKNCILSHGFCRCRVHSSAELSDCAKLFAQTPFMMCVRWWWLGGGGGQADCGRLREG